MAQPQFVADDHIKRHGTHLAINPTGIVSAGPDLSGWTTPHGRG